MLDQQTMLFWSTWVLMIVYACSIYGSAIGFGRPYSIIFVSIAGLFVLLFLNKFHVGLVDWTDKLSSMVLALAANVEGIYLHIRHLARLNNRNEQKSFFLFVLYFSFRIRSSLNFYLVFLLDFCFNKNYLIFILSPWRLILDGLIRSDGVWTDVGTYTWI